MTMNDYSNMRANEELAALFSRSLTFQPQPQQPVQQTQPVTESKPEPAQEQPIIYSITQHYTHSAHITREPEPEPMVELQRPSSEPPQTQQHPAEAILGSYGIDHRTLSASQMELFKTAGDEQKMRLMELWRICPPSNQQENPAVALGGRTTLEQEEMLAQLRHERNVTGGGDDSIMSLDGTPLTPVQTGDGTWVAMASPDMEPYMMTGYEALARREYEESAKRAFEESMTRPKVVYHGFGNNGYRPATDPVYNTNNNNSWASRQEAMENQYGAFQMGNEMEL